MPLNNIDTETISLAHGNGGVNSRQLIEEVFLSEFNPENIGTNNDAASIICSKNMKITTDGFTVDPLFFPGGDIGKLSICGTINDLVVSGAIPLYLSCSFFIEEGFSKNKLIKIAKSMALTAKENNAQIVTGDTKILPKGNVSGLYISTTGIGKSIRTNLSTSQIKAGDHVHVTGSIGDHGAAIMLAREEYGLSSQLKSDCASMLEVGSALINDPAVKFMRDPTRGGLATVCHEIIGSTSLGITLKEKNIPIRQEVNTFCEILGLSPFYLACEGRILFITNPTWQPSEKFLKKYPVDKIGIIEKQHSNLLLETHLGGLRFIPELDSDPLPRIC